MSSYLELARRAVPKSSPSRHETNRPNGRELNLESDCAESDISDQRPASFDCFFGKLFRLIGSRVPPDTVEWTLQHRPDLWRSVDAAEVAMNEAALDEDRAALREASIAFAEAFVAILDAAPVAAPVVTVTEAPPSRPVLIDRQAGLPRVLEELQKVEILGADVETTGLNPRKDQVRLLSLATGGDTYVIDLFAVNSKPLWPVLMAKTIVLHHAAFDLAFLRALGFEPGQVADTILLSQLLSAGLLEPKGHHSLASTAERELGLSLPKELQQSDWSGILSPAQVEYGARDAAVLLSLHVALTEKIVAAGLERIADVENRCLPAIVWMTAAGVPFDTTAWGVLTGEAEREATRLRGELDKTAPKTDTLDLGYGWNWDSPKEVLAAFARAGVTLEDTSDETLATCDHPVAALLRQYRSVQKLLGSYGEGWLKYLDACRLFPEWRQLGSRAGRMSCRNPNLQQVPRDRRYRACIAAESGRLLVKADYSQIELRIAARIADEKKMQDAYLHGEDLHTLTARNILGRQSVSKEDRQLAKAVNFGLLYGMGAKGFRIYARVQYGVELSPGEASRYRRRFFEAYPGLQQWHYRQPDGEIETRTVAGRRRLQVEPFTWKVNSPVQGTGADGLKQALALLWERRQQCPGAVPVIACHDEIVLECGEAQAPEAAAWLRQAMLDGMQPLADPVPVEVEVQIGRTWAG